MKIAHTECSNRTSHVLRDNNWVLVLLGHQDGACVRVVQRVYEHFVGQHIQLLLLVTGGVKIASNTDYCVCQKREVENLRKSR